MDRFDLVERSFNELVAEGVVKRLPNDTPDLPSLIEKQKAAITRRAAYYMNTMVDPNIGLLFKNWGNFVQDLAVDILFRKDGVEFDIASSDDTAEGVIARIVNASGSSEGTAIDRWRMPTEVGAGLVSSVILPNQDTPLATGDLEKKIETLTDLLKEANENIVILSKTITSFKVAFPSYQGTFLTRPLVVHPFTPEE